MANPERVQEEQGDARARILRAAAEAIAERGWGGVRTRNVAERAGVNNALIHYYFGSRQQLLREAALDTLLSTLQAPADLLAGAPTLAEGLRGAVGWIRGYSAAPQSPSLLAEAMLEAGRDEPLRAALGDAVVGLRAQLAARLRAEDARRDEGDAAGVAMVLAAALDGLLLHYLLDPALDLDRAAAALGALVGEREASVGGADEREG